MNNKVREISGGPTKRFFVSMLPRDIELGDAILDLVDNSVDGAMRQRRKSLQETNVYKGFRCNLEISEEEFRITDNCGGIPKEYIDSAFRLGRPQVDKDGDLPTIGMYGIGMKRAIFKMGLAAKVSSVTDGSSSTVEYTEDWLDPENDDFTLSIGENNDDQSGDGVHIEIKKLKPEIARQFARTSFVNKLADSISEHFAYLMIKGFEVCLNGSLLKPRTIQVAVSDNLDNGIQPYNYTANFDGVDVNITVGLYRRLTTEDEIESSTLASDAVERAGISVICNDRVVLVSDRTAKTGWGLGSVPRYHPQFRAIAGVVIFTAAAAAKLPISTTKRDLDTDSDVYVRALNAVSEGIVTFTSFTNKWKGKERETDKLIEQIERVEATSISLAAQHGISARGQGGGARKYVPNLPRPQTERTTRRIAFSKDIGEIHTVSKHLFGDANVAPGDVGSACFDWILKSSKE